MLASQVEVDIYSLVWGWIGTFEICGVPVLTPTQIGMKSFTFLTEGFSDVWFALVL